MVWSFLYTAAYLKQHSSNRQQIDRWGAGIVPFNSARYRPARCIYTGTQSDAVDDVNNGVDDEAALKLKTTNAPFFALLCFVIFVHATVT